MTIYIYTFLITNISRGLNFYVFPLDIYYIFEYDLTYIKKRDEN